jgi:adenylate cyclase
MDRDRFARAGLYDPTAPDAERRLELLRYLATEGITIDEMVEATSADRLTIAAADRLLRGGRERLTLAEVCERAGVDVELARRTWLADGFPDPEDAPIFSEADVQIFPTMQVAVAAFGEDVFLELARVLGASIARIAEAEVAAFAATLAAPLLREDAGEVAIARAFGQVAQLLPMVDGVVARLHRHHLEAAIRRLAYTAEGVGLQPATTPMAIGFADLSGYTALSGQLPVDDLLQLLAQFNAAASDTVTASGGRVVKLIGDEVMFVTPSPTAACSVTFALRRSMDSLGVPLPLRMGVAYGTVLTRDGDFYGPVVNLAARAAGVAGAGRTLVDFSVREAVGNETAFDVRDAGTFSLKGFADPVQLFELVATDE